MCIHFLACYVITGLEEINFLAFLEGFIVNFILNKVLMVLLHNNFDPSFSTYTI